MRVLILNPGSSSLKSSVVDTANLRPGQPVAPLAKIDVDWGVDATAASTAPGSGPTEEIRRLLARYEAQGIETASLGAVGYRVVHGGTRFREPARIGPAMVGELDALRDLAPLHNGVAVATIRGGLAAAPQLPHVAVFDTAFHATLPEEGYRYPVPERWYREWGVRRYGFHGISVAWSAERAATLLGGVADPARQPNLVVAHLGSGCSVTAVSAGRSVATSMGLTPLEGLMMGTRSGSIDPGIVFALVRDGRLTLDELADRLDHASGLVGVSGRTSDVRELLAMEAERDEPAARALAMGARRAAESIGAAATSLPALDALVFTGGIGENASTIRSRIVDRLRAVGFSPVDDAPVGEDAVLSKPGVRPAVVRIEAREDLVIAREAARLVEAQRP
jgi:acetate kinase